MRQENHSYFRFLILDLRFDFQSEIANPKSKIAKVKPRAEQRGAFHQSRSIHLGKDSPSCLAGYFTWPQVALTHHV